MENNDTRNLKSLKDDYNKGIVSALVGAGFSKNVSSSLYMDWSTLLEDIIDDLFKLEIQQYVNNPFHLRMSSMDKEENEKKLKKEFVDHILKQHGYLGIVSKYIYIKRDIERLLKTI